MHQRSREELDTYMKRLDEKFQDLRPPWMKKCLSKFSSMVCWKDFEFPWRTCISPLFFKLMEAACCTSVSV